MKIFFLLGILSSYGLNFSPLSSAIPQVEIKKIAQAQLVDDYILEKIDAVLIQMQKFFFLTHEVARWKWNHNALIEDGPKDQAILEKFSQRGAALGLDSSLVREIFKAQLEASKMIQERDFEQWRKEGISQFGAIGDFKKDMRPQIEQICDEFLIKLTDVLPLLRKSNLSEVIKWRSTIILVEEGVTDPIRDVALKPFIMLCAQIGMK